MDPHLVWPAPLVAAAGAPATYSPTSRLATSRLVGLAAAAPLRFRPSEQAHAWRRGAEVERHTARLLDRLTRDGYVVFHAPAVPGSLANLDHLVIGPTGPFVIDTKRWTGSVHQSADGLAWHHHSSLDRTLATVHWEVKAVGRLLGTHTTPGVRPRRPRPWRRPARPGRGHRTGQPAPQRARL